MNKAIYLLNLLCLIIFILFPLIKFKGCENALTPSAPTVIQFPKLIFSSIEILLSTNNSTPLFVVILVT